MFIEYMILATIVIIVISIMAALVVETLNTTKRISQKRKIEREKRKNAHLYQ